jgi:hypothetical protein
MEPERREQLDDETPFNDGTKRNVDVVLKELPSSTKDTANLRGNSRDCVGGYSEALTSC